MKKADREKHVASLEEKLIDAAKAAEAMGLYPVGLELRNMAHAYGNAPAVELLLDAKGRALPMEMQPHIKGD